MAEAQESIPVYYKWQSTGHSLVVYKTDLCLLFDTAKSPLGIDRQPNVMVLMDSNKNLCAIQSKCPACNSDMTFDLVMKYVVCHKHQLTFRPSTGEIMKGRNALANGQMPRPDIQLEVFDTRVDSKTTYVEILHPETVFPYKV